MSIQNRICWPLALFLALTLAGCAVGPDYERPQVESPDAWRVDYAAAADVSNMRWWEQFEDPALNELIDIALKENWDVRIAAARVEEFAARVDMAFSEFLPQVDYQGAGFRRRISPDDPDIADSIDRTAVRYGGAANLNWELDLWGRIRRSNEAARAELLAQEENRRTVILSLVSAVAHQYVELRRYDRQLQVAINTRESQAETLRLFQLKFKGGVVSEIEVAQVRSNYEKVASHVPRYQRKIALTENALSVLLGRNPGAIPRGKTIDELILPPIPEGVPSTLLARRPDIRSAEQKLIAANALIGVARAQYFPTISLTGILGVASDSLSSLFGNANSLWQIGGNALGPIFAGGRISAQVRASEAVQRQTLMNYLQTVRTAFQEVNDGLISVQKRREQLEARGRKVQALADYARLANLRYDEGYADYLEVLDAERSLFDDQIQYVRLQSYVYEELVATYKAMGGGWIIEAQNTADEVDFPPEKEDQQLFFDFPKFTQPIGATGSKGYQSATQ
jgi:multidrug efflux system outer membrane protein